MCYQNYDHASGIDMATKQINDLQSHGVVDLFCGAGGLSAGFERIGFPIISAVDNNNDILDTFEYNHNCTPINLDLSNENVLEANYMNVKTNSFTPNDIDVVIGGPPCKGFSQANHQTGTADNPKNSLLLNYINLAMDIDPEVIVLENVPNMLSVGDGYFKKEVYSRLHSGGYHVISQELSAENFGVPQRRCRVFILASREKELTPPSTFEPEFRDPPSIRDAIFDLPDLPEGGGGSDRMEYDPRLSSDFDKIEDMSYIKKMRENIEEDQIYNHQSTRNREKTYERFSHIPQGGNWKDIPEELMDNYKNLDRTHDNIYLRLSEDDLAKTVANFRKQMMIHPTEDRLLTVREAARLQSFPDDYRFTGDKITIKQQMVGNAVPLNLAEAVAKSVAGYFV